VTGSWAEVRRLLVMRLDNIGDVVMTGPVLRALKENLPRASITLMASPGGKEAAPLLPWVDEVFAWRVLWQAPLLRSGAGVGVDRGLAARLLRRGDNPHLL